MPNGTSVVTNRNLNWTLKSFVLVLTCSSVIVIVIETPQPQVLKITWYVQYVAVHMRNDGCLHCEQDREYECSLIADGGSTTDNPVGLTLDELRSTRVALLSNCDSVERAAGNEGNMPGGAMHHAQDPAYLVSPSALIFREQVSPPVPGTGEQALLIVIKLCQLELAAGVGVICEVYSLFWK